MGFVIISVSAVTVFILCTIYIQIKWKHYANDFFGVQGLRQINILSRVWPDDDNFMSLVYSALRHTLVCIGFAALIWFVNARWLNTILLFLYISYTCFLYFRYRARKDDFKQCGESTQEHLRAVKAACFSVLACSIVDYVLLMVCYGIRP